MWFEQIMTRETLFLDAVKSFTYYEKRHFLQSDQKMRNKQMSKTSGQLLPCERGPLCNQYLMNNIMKEHEIS